MLLLICVKLSFPDAPREFRDINNDHFKIQFTVHYNPHTHPIHKSVTYSVKIGTLYDRRIRYVRFLKFYM